VNNYAGILLTVNPGLVRPPSVSAGSILLQERKGIPEEMVKEIDRLVQKRRYGYTSRADVVADAVRRLMAELKSLSK